jgi:hypothetical protein
VKKKESRKSLIGMKGLELKGGYCFVKTGKKGKAHKAHKGNNKKAWSWD